MMHSAKRKVPYEEQILNSVTVSKGVVLSVLLAPVGFRCH